MSHDAKMRKCAYLLADRHLSELSTDAIIAACPRHYGLELTDEHKLFMWNGLVDHYLEQTEGELWRLFDKHIAQKEPIVKLELWEPLPADLEAVVSQLVDAIWKVNTEMSSSEDEGTSQKSKLRLTINENTD